MIELTRVEKRWGALTVLAGASLSIKKGEVAVLLGASGSGKSTLLRCVNGLEELDGGEVRVGDVSHRAGMPRAEREAALLRLRKKVGMVFQQFHLFPHMSALENVLVGPVSVLGRPRAEAEPLAMALLERVGMKAHAHARPETLSGGEQQRVAIARALAISPEAILFDEPTSALDPRRASEVLAVMADLAKSGQTMIVVTHAIHFARKAAHTVHVMGEGRIVESGPPARVLDAPEHPLTRHLLADAQEAA